MSSHYKTITDRIIVLLEAEQGFLLDDGLTTPVASINKGQYVPNATGEKPVIYVRLEGAGLISDLAGGLTRLERVMLRFSGAVAATTQEVAQDEMEKLAANLENILEHYPTDSGIWGGSRLGWSYSDSDENAEGFIQTAADVGTDISIAHFVLRWSCDVRVSRDGTPQ